MAPLFALRSASGEFRRTGEMMRKDLEAARSLWLQEVEEGTPERKRREESSFLTYQDTEGLFADFHANRHTFITNLGRAGVSLAMAQKLARHSDPRLTANIYTHLELVEQADAISQLPAPAPTTPTESLVTGEDVKTCRCSAELDAEEGSHTCSLETRKPLPEQGFSSDCQCISSARPVGFEPTTLGSEDRSASSVSSLHDNDLRKPSNSGYRDGYRTGERSASQQCSTCRQLPDELRRVIEAWPKLPEHIQRAVLALIDTAST